jgi:hypothetical protein
MDTEDCNFYNLAEESIQKILTLSDSAGLGHRAVGRTPAGPVGRWAAGAGAAGEPRRDSDPQGRDATCAGLTSEIETLLFVSMEVSESSFDRIDLIR